MSKKDTPNRMSVKEFRKLGFLQELNRQFLHPLGLALEVEVDAKTGDEKFGFPWDYRHDPKGIIFIEEPDKSEDRRRKYESVLAHKESCWAIREKALGFFVQSIDEIAPKS